MMSIHISGLPFVLRGESAVVTLSTVPESTETYSDLFLTPHGLLRLERFPASSAWVEPDTGARVEKAFGQTPARGLLHLATRELETGFHRWVCQSAGAGFFEANNQFR